MLLRAPLHAAEVLANLRLDGPKSVLVPLAEWSAERREEMQRWLMLFIPTWSSFIIKPYAKYLGFILGPDAANNSWTGPLDKYRHRARLIGLSHAPPQAAVEQWNTSVASVLPYWGQLARPPQMKVHEESNLMNSALHSPPHTFSRAFMARAHEIGLQGMRVAELWCLSAAVRCAIVTLPQSASWHDWIIEHSTDIGRFIRLLPHTRNSLRHGWTRHMPWSPHWSYECFASFHAAIVGTRELTDRTLQRALTVGAAEARRLNAHREAQWDSE